MAQRMQNKLSWMRRLAMRCLAFTAGGLMICAGHAQTWVRVNDLNVPRDTHTATLLQDGSVLVATC